jgi:hypothetical protein
VRSLVVLVAAALEAGGCTSSVDGTAAPQSAGNPTGRSFGKYLGYRVLVGSAP